MCFMDHKSQSSISDSVTTKVSEGKITKPKEKRRNNEKRKEKSRDAARCRRSRESEIFNELGETLPIRKDDLENLDKASVMRLAIATLKIENMLKLFKVNIDAEDQQQTLKKFNEQGVIKALDGFFVALSDEGDITYVSENIHEYIGIQQIDVIGNPIWEYTHQCDHSELRDILNCRRRQDRSPENTSNEVEKMSQNFLIRIKCTITSRGRNVNIKSASYKVVNIVGHIVLDEYQHHHQFIGIARLIPHPSNIEVPLDSKTFLSKHTLDMKFSYVDDKMLPILGYKPSDLLEKSLYEYHHGADSEKLMSAFKNVINKGQVETPQYRFLGRNGGFCWVVSQATLVYDKQKPQSVVCVNYVISDLLDENEVYSLRQLEVFNKSLKNEIPELKERSDIKWKEIENCVEVQNKTSKLTNINRNKSSNKVVTIENTGLGVLEDDLGRRALIANQYKITKPIRSNPKAVTASVFKVLPSMVNTLTKQTDSANITSIQSSEKQTLVTSTAKSSFMTSEPTDISGSFGKLHSTITEPSLIPRPTVVTALLFQPRLEKKLSDLRTDFNYSVDMKTTFRSVNKDICQATHESTTLNLSNNTESTKNSGALNKISTVQLTNDDSFGDINVDSTPLFGEMFNELILPDSYCTLLPEEIQSIDVQGSKINIGNDFINSTDRTKELSGKPGDVFSSKSIECSSSLPSLCSPHSSNHNGELALMSTSLSNTNIDLSMRAPYIPMNENDDLPLLTEDLMWSTFSNEASLHKNIKMNTDCQPHQIKLQPINAANVDHILINKIQNNLSEDDNNTDSIKVEIAFSTMKQSVNNISSLENIEGELKIEDENFSEISIKDGNNGSALNCSSNTFTADNFKDDSKNENVATYQIQNDARLKEGVDEIILPWIINDSHIEFSCPQIDRQTIVPLHPLSDPAMLPQKSEAGTLNGNFKRCSSLEVGVNKRLKGQAHVAIGPGNNQQNECQNLHQDIFPRSHLLQQLMARTPVKNEEMVPSEEFNIKENFEEKVEWNRSIAHNQLGDRSSESVLKNLLCKNITMEDDSDRSKFSKDGKRVSQRGGIIHEGIKNQNKTKSRCNDDFIIYGLKDDVFFVQGVKPTCTSTAENLIKKDSIIIEKNPFETFEKQITITVPQPPPLRAEAFTIGGGLFQGLTEHTSILPTPLISPIESSKTSNLSHTIDSETMNMWIPDIE